MKISTATLSKHPQPISDTDWYLEGADSLIVVHEVRIGKQVRTDTIKIPWHMLFRSVNRAKGITKRERRIINKITKPKHEKTHCD